jgi:glycosyltransferase involved in cell wall biosynthesis
VRIDFVITELFVGGAERCLTEMAIGLARRGEKVRVASIGPFPPSNQAKFVERLEAAGIELLSTNCSHPMQFVKARRMLRHWMRSDPPDVVQTMLFHANVMGTSAAQAANVPVRIGGVRVAERSRIRTFAESWAMKRMSAVVCVSESVREFVKTSHKPKTPLYVIGNSVDIAQVDATPAVQWHDLLVGGDQVLLFVGRLHSQKGLHVLFEALPSLLAKHKEMLVVIVGDGPLRSWTEAQASAIDGNRIKVMGWRADAHSLIKGCRLLVLPSRYEGMPNVVMEAMAASKPVAVTRVEGVSELLREGAIDQTCPPNDVAELRTLLDHLWSDPQRASVIGQRNREIIAAHHSTAAMVESYRDLYRSLLDQKLNHTAGP